MESAKFQTFISLISLYFLKYAMSKSQLLIFPLKPDYLTGYDLKFLPFLVNTNCIPSVTQTKTLLSPLTTLSYPIFSLQVFTASFAFKIQSSATSSHPICLLSQPHHQLWPGLSLIACYPVFYSHLLQL